MEIAKLKWYLTTKNGMFLSIQKLCTKNFNLTIRFGFGIIQFKIHFMAFKLFTKKSMGGKIHEGKKLKIAPRRELLWINLPKFGPNKHFYVLYFIICI